MPTPAVSSSPPPGHGTSLFHELLEDLNPLQYVPVVGTIYRAITGDEGNPTLRFAASLGTSFALGGPIGVAITVGERMAGIDPERMALNAARHLFQLGHGQAPAAMPAAEPVAPAQTQMAFAVDSSGMTADQLNGLELQRLAG
ncbi:hypothetical protein [Lichenicoccus sp.]|uniref:hypothetical protein n=1 Tax=Lichenicoccus sp. TaxID=2781899 RepID=UPI003D0DDC9D